MEFVKPLTREISWTSQRNRGGQMNRFHHESEKDGDDSIGRFVAYWASHQKLGNEIRLREFPF